MNAAKEVLSRHRRTAAVTGVLRASMLDVIKFGQLDGFALSDLPEDLAGTFCGFDVTFADRCLRMIVTASKKADGNVTIECYRAKQLTKAPLAPIAAVELDRHDGFTLTGAGAADMYMPTIDGASAILNYFVSAACFEAA